MTRSRSSGRREPPGPSVMIGESAVMRELREEIRMAGPTDYPAVVLGESGTGKELVVWRIHGCSRRSRLNVVNTAAIPTDLLGSELFGHVQGSFTGALRDRRGRFEAAGGGTLYLDEIGDLSLALQAQLLRAIELGEVQRVGEDEVRYVNVRVIAATNRDLEREVQEGRFRGDLYQRFTWRIDVPPLRARGGDIMLLAEHFAGETPIDARTHRLLEAYGWPGNVRELKRAIEVGAVRSKGGVILVEHLPIDIRDAAMRALASGKGDHKLVTSRGMRDRKLPADDVEARHLFIDAMVAEGGNKRRAADRLGISRTYLYHKMRHLDIKESDWRDDQAC